MNVKQGLKKKKSKRSFTILTWLWVWASHPNSFRSFRSPCPIGPPCRTNSRLLAIHSHNQTEISTLLTFWSFTLVSTLFWVRGNHWQWSYSVKSAPAAARTCCPGESSVRWGSWGMEHSCDPPSGEWRRFTTGSREMTRLTGASAKGQPTAVNGHPRAKGKTGIHGILAHHGHTLMADKHNQTWWSLNTSGPRDNFLGVDEVAPKARLINKMLESTEKNMHAHQMGDQQPYIYNSQFTALYFYGINFCMFMAASTEHNGIGWTSSPWCWQESSSGELWV